MHNIILKTFELIDVLDKSDLIVNLTKYKQLVMEDSFLLSLLDRGNSSDSIDEIREIKRKLYDNDNYRNYMHYYNELFYIVMKYNMRIKEIINTRECYNASDKW